MSVGSSAEAADRSFDPAVIRKGAGIVSLVLAVITPPVGLVLSIATLIWARRSGEKGILAVCGVVVSVVLLITMVIVGFVLFGQLVNAANDGLIDVQALCVHRDRWGWLIDSLRYACR